SGRAVKVHSTVETVLYAVHSTRIRRFCSTSLATTFMEWLYISQSHSTSLPGSNRPVPLVNQNFDVIAGSTKASNTSATFLRISFSALATRGRSLFILYHRLCVGIGSILMSIIYEGSPKSSTEKR